MKLIYNPINVLNYNDLSIEQSLSRDNTFKNTPEIL